LKSIRPRARTNRLVTRDLGDELLVYDLDRHRAYCFNQIAMQVFRHCDGKTTIPEMARRIGDAVSMPVSEDVVRLGLARLEKAHLLDSAVAQGFRISRREILSTLGRAAVVVMPLVTAIAVPTSAQAQATGVCPTLGQPCHSTADCGNPSMCKCNPPGFCMPK
jgi:hypothetical protein